MAYRQIPGRGPTAAFENVKALLGPTATEGNGVDPKTGVKDKTMKIDRPSVQSEKAPSWTDNYSSATYVTKGGKGIKKFTPNSNVVGGSVRYYDINKKNSMSSMNEINQKEFVNYLEKGDKETGQKYNKITEKDIVTGGDTEVLKELRSS